MARLYRRTAAGRKAWDTQATQVPLEYRRVLGLVSDDSDPKDVCAKLGWSEDELCEILDELVGRGLVARIETDDTDLDFTA
jgi:hypothetical protein